MLTKGTAHRGLKRDEIIRRKNLRVNQNYAQSKIVRVPHLFGSRLRIAAQPWVPHPRPPDFGDGVGAILSSPEGETSVAQDVSAG